ncbi:MAG TPA: hypothetical protein VHE61_16390 [Opitutaceae bacterium]|nr:hypothetical protein [Opitutaceae bacterium]
MKTSPDVRMRTSALARKRALLRDLIERARLGEPEGDNIAAFPAVAAAFTPNTGNETPDESNVIPFPIQRTR